MKIKIEVDESIQEEEVIIRCSEFNNKIQNIQKIITNILTQKESITFYKNNTEYYLDLKEILFFETEESSVNAHTFKDVYKVKYKLYELEEMLPGYFMRISKSTILNTSHIYSITRSLSSSSIVEFKGTHKKVYVSRHYYKPLKIKLLEGSR